MTVKVNGAAYPGVWVERKVAFVKLTFSKDIAALAAADLLVLGTSTPAPALTTASSVFGVVESVIVQALKTLETKATVLAVSTYDATAFSVDVMLGNAEGWFSDAAGLILPLLSPVGAAQAVVTGGPLAAGTLVSVAPAAVTYKLEFAAFNGTMPVGTLANGTLKEGIGATSGAFPYNSATGTPGFYPGSI